MLHAFLVDMGDQEPFRLQQRDDGLAGLGGRQPDQLGRDQPVSDLDDPRLGIEHVEHFARFHAGALAHLEIVEVMSGGDLHRART